MTDTPAVIREFYSSDDDDSRLRMGPMRFPILDKAIELGAGTWWTVTRYFYPNSIQQYRSLEALVKGSGYQTVKVSERIAHVPTGSTIDNIINVNAIGGKVTVIRGDWKLSDIGLTLYQNCVTDADGTVTTIPGKEAKRMKAFARPFRIHTAREKLNVLVVEAKTYHEVYDGASLISDTLVNECVDNLSYPNQEDYIYNKTRSWFLDQMVFNGLIIGNLFNAETGLNLDRMIKGQFFRTRLPEGIDIVTSPDNLKHEIIGNKYAFVGIDPQGPKVAKEDQQTVANHWFLCPPSIAKIRLEDEAFIKKQEVFDGKFNQSLKDLVSKSYRTDNAYSETSFASLMKWRINAWAAHGMDYRNSTWLTTRISDIWPKSLGDRTANWNNSLKVNVPCAIRAQVICESMYNLWRHFEGQLPITVPDGYLHFSEQLKLGVVSDEDWVNIVIPSHGGCDQDDFFMLRWVMLIETLEPGQSNKRIIIHRNPNTRGEYSVWKVLEDDWHPTYTRPNGDVITFPEISFEDAPLQILEALKLGVTQYLPLPSEEGDDDTDHLFKGIVEYDPQSALKSIEQSMEVSGGYGQYELAVRARNSIDPKSFDTMQINSESAIDAFAQVRALDDQKFIIADRARIIANIVKGLKPVDEYIAPRLGNLNIYGSSQGPIALIKRECINVITQYKQDVAAEVAKLARALVAR